MGWRWQPHVKDSRLLKDSGMNLLTAVLALGFLGVGAALLSAEERPERFKIGAVLALTGPAERWGVVTQAGS